MAAADPILSVENIVKRFETPDGVLTAVDDVSFTVAPGEFLSVIGPSGCGKSTLFNVIGGLVDGYDGTVRVGGETLRGPHASIGMIFQEESTFPWRTVIDNVAFPLEIIGMPKKERLEKARHFVKLVGLDGFERRYPAELSGGMRQRVNLARALAIDPDVLLMDEPFASLDAQTRRMMQAELVRIWAAAHKTVLFITHDLDESIVLADRIGIMTAGPAARLREVIEVRLPRPRARTDPGFMEVFQRCDAIIEEEVRASLREHA